MFVHDKMYLVVNVFFLELVPMFITPPISYIMEFTYLVSLYHFTTCKSRDTG